MTARYNTRACVPRVDVNGIYVLSTTGKIVTASAGEESQIDFGVNPFEWCALPEAGVLIWRVRYPVTTTEASYAVNVVVPNGYATTVQLQSTQVGTNRIPVVDHHNVQVIGSDVNVPVNSNSGSPVLGGYTEHIVWFNKPQGIFRLLGVKSSNNPTPAAQGSNTPAEASVSKGK
ncbi:hypothetical protein [Parabacteroides chongii]|uniref:hypothetical protein n=1 Tax=Parabacteroides chongii TaxID=2685834 RepID=UPI00240D7700|nr:hypothetical protein [Parabacteroides chongii]WFE84962.1 hypothetical protein P3L47_23065 [Parabacteroides chongii]